MVAHITSATNSQTITATTARIGYLTAAATIGEAASASVGLIVSPTSAQSASATTQATTCATYRQTIAESISATVT